MSDFVREKVVQLDRALLRLFSDNAQCLASPCREINLTTGLPDIAVVRESLQLFIRHSEDYHDDVACLFIAKCTIAIYGYIVDTLLNSTLPLSEALAYWQSIYGSKRYETYYALQTLPLRICHVGIHAVQRLRTTTTTTTTASSSQKMPVPKRVLCSMFPTARQRRPSLLSFQLKHTPMPTRLIHEEIRQKIQQLNYHKRLQASKLGLMVKSAPSYTHVDHKSAVAVQSSRCIMMMQQVLNIDHLITESAISNKMPALETLDMAHRLSDILEKWNSDCQVQIRNIYATYGPPSLLTRCWVPGVLGLVASAAAIRMVVTQQQDILQWSQKLGATIKDCAVEWIWEPILQMCAIICPKSSIEPAIATKEGLSDELKSLENTISEFVCNHYKLSSEHVNAVMDRVREGDMSLILRAYEDEIKSPLRSAITGDLAEALSIQAQKAKVDIDLATTALDKLLDSNELNFAFLAIVPSILLSWAGAAWIRRIYNRRSGRQVGKAIVPLRDTLRRIERLLELSLLSTTVSSKDDTLDCESQGSLLCELHLLRSYSQSLSRRNSTRDLFIEDLRDLESPHLTIRQKLQTIDRMCRVWMFLDTNFSRK